MENWETNMSLNYKLSYGIPNAYSYGNLSLVIFQGVWTSAPHPLWAHPCCLRVAESTHFSCILIVRWSQVSFHGLAGQKRATHEDSYWCWNLPSLLTTLAVI